MTDLLSAICAIVGDDKHTLEAAVLSRNVDREWKSMADSSRVVSRECTNCGWEGDAEEITDLGGSRWTCPECDEPHDSTEDHDYEDPDADRDRWLDDLS